MKDICCTSCNKAFGRSDHLKNHVLKYHGNPLEIKESDNSRQSIAVSDNLTMIEIPEDRTYNVNQQSSNITYVFQF